MNKTKISCAELLEFVPDSLLEKIEAETKINYQVKKLNGKIVFKLLLMSLLDFTRELVCNQFRMFLKQIKLYKYAIRQNLARIKFKNILSYFHREKLVLCV